MCFKMQPLIFFKASGQYTIADFINHEEKNDKAIITNVKLAITHPQKFFALLS